MGDFIIIFSEEFLWGLSLYPICVCVVEIRMYDLQSLYHLVKSVLFFGGTFVGIEGPAVEDAFRCCSPASLFLLTTIPCCRHRQIEALPLSSSRIRFGKRGWGVYADILVPN